MRWKRSPLCIDVFLQSSSVTRSRRPNTRSVPLQSCKYSPAPGVTLAQKRGRALTKKADRISCGPPELLNNCCDNYEQCHPPSPTTALIFRLRDASNGRDSVKSRGKALRQSTGRVCERSSRIRRRPTVFTTARDALRSVPVETSRPMAVYCIDEYSHSTR